MVSALKHPFARQIACRNSTASPTLTTFRINTCKSVSKQTTLTPFRMNTYEKRGEGGTIAFPANNNGIGRSGNRSDRRGVANKGLGGVLAERPVPGRKRPGYMLGDADVPIL